MLYNMNFGTGKMEPIDESQGDKNHLPVGTVLTLNGYSNPDYVITANRGVDPKYPYYGAAYDCICLDTGEYRRHQAYSLARLTDKKDNRIQLYITDEVMDGETMAAALEKAKTIKEENDRKAKEKAEARAREIAALPGRYPYLKTGTYEKVGAENIRTELKREFPGVKFSVRIETRGSSSINIGWTDGPTTEQVKKITDKYQQGNFNGMEDIYEYNRENLWCDVFGGAKYVFENRHESPELIARAAKELGYELPHGESDNYGKLHGLDWEHSQRIYRQARTMAVETERPGKKKPDTVSVATIRRNEEKNGIEVIFPTKPETNVIDTLKDMGFRWSKFQGLWWRKYDESIMTQLAEVI